MCTIDDRGVGDSPPKRYTSLPIWPTAMSAATGARGRARVRAPMVAATRSERACGSFPITWDPCRANVCTLSMVTASPPPKTMTLVPNGAAAASWVATASDPPGVTVSLTGKKRCTDADELPPARPPRTRIVWPSATVEALDIAVRRPFAMASTFNAGELVDSVDVGGAVDVGDEAAPVGVKVAAGRPPVVPTLLVP